MNYNIYNTRNTEFNKNVIMVWTEEPGFTGYKGFDFTKIDNIESTIENSLSVTGNNYLSGIHNSLKSLDQKLNVTGDQNQALLVYQADLNAAIDNVDIAGYAGADISGLNNAVFNNFPVYDSIQLKYDGSNNTTGVFYKIGESVVREIKMMYNGSNVTGIFKTDY